MNTSQGVCNSPVSICDCLVVDKETSFRGARHTHNTTHTNTQPLTIIYKLEKKNEYAFRVHHGLPIQFSNEE